MEIYVPDIYQKNIYEINYDVLVSRGIKCLIFDLDNTLVTILEKVPREETKSTTTLKTRLIILVELPFVFMSSILILKTAILAKSNKSISKYLRGNS